MVTDHGPANARRPEHRKVERLPRLQSERCRSWRIYRPGGRPICLMLPVKKCISASSSRNRIQSTSRQIESAIGQENSRQTLIGQTDESKESKRVSTISADSAWLRCARPMPGYGHRVQITLGRATLADGTNRVCALVGCRINSKAQRLDQFLDRCGVRWYERVIVISDSANESAKAVIGNRLARGQTLDWFLSAMKF